MPKQKCVICVCDRDQTMQQSAALDLFNNIHRGGKFRTLVSAQRERDIIPAEMEVISLLYC